MTLKLPETDEMKDQAQERGRRWWDRMRRARAPGSADLARLRERMAMPEHVTMPDLPTMSELVERANQRVKQLPDLRKQVPDLQKQLPDIRWSELPEEIRKRTRRPARAAVRWPSSGLTILAIALSGIAGAVAAYLLDPERGRARRIEIADRLAAAGRKAGREVGRATRYTMSTAGSLGERVTQRNWSYVPPNDAALGEKIESELFADPSIEKGRLNINVENGVVILRGTAATPEEIARIVAAARRIAGVQDVQSLLHVPGSPAYEQTTAAERWPDEQVPTNPGL